MVSLGSAASPLRAAAFAFAALIAVQAARGESAPQTVPSQAEAPPAEASSSAEAAKAEPAQLQGPEKPSINLALRAALSREDASRLTPDMRARRQAVDAFYASRGDAPVWLDNGHWTIAARAVFETLKTAADDGLDLRATRVYSLDQGPETSLALGDIALSQAVAAYAFQASGGRIDPARISHLIAPRAGVVSPAQALEETSKAADAGAVLQAYNPRQPGYIALREKLGRTRAEPMNGPVARLAARDTSRRASDAVGSIGRRGATLESEILVNMEFWRWLPRDLGRDRLMVNVPEFTARLYRDDSLELSTRVIVGKPDKTTPLFSNQMEYLIVNPSWNVPQSIIKNEMMNKLDSLRRQGYDVEWVNGKLRVRQPPGERNALGQIKFIFPNDYAVYMHDTPTRNLFQASVRAFSHGCVRVDQPFKLAETLLRPERGWTEARLRKMVGKNERRVALPAPLPVHIVYFTMAEDELGQWRRFDDIYGYSGKARELLGMAP